MRLPFLKLLPATGAIALVLLAGVAACDGTAPAERGPLIVVDGEFADWDTVPPLLVDPAENGAGAVDFGEVRVESDDGAVYFALDLGRPVNAQAMQGTVHLDLDTDGDSTTGETKDGFNGVDRTIALSPMRPFDGPVGRGITTAAPGIYEIGFDYAPTWASRYFEIRMDRNVFAADTVRGRLRYTTHDLGMADWTDPFGFVLRSGSGRDAVSAGLESIERSASASFRLLAWNVADRGPVEAADVFDLVLRTLDPDVVLFDEVSPDIDEGWFTGRLSPLGGDWTVVRGTAGGRQTALIASRLPVKPVPALTHVDYPEAMLRLSGARQLDQDLATGAADGIPLAGAMLDAGGARVLLAALDMPCCGYAGSVEDRARIMMAEAVHDAVLEAMAGDAPDAVVLAGDVNVVGSRTPLDQLLAGLDPGGGDLSPVRAPRLDHVSLSTWQNPDEVFPPGRLDWVLHSPTVLEPVHAFVFDPADLDADAARSLGFTARDSNVVSDHLPIVVDFAIRR